MTKFAVGATLLALLAVSNAAFISFDFHSVPKVVTTNAGAVYPSSVTGKIAPQAFAPVYNLSQAQIYYYYMTIYVGTPPQPISVLIDTGSSDLWVPSSTCAPCASKLRFNATQSSTYSAVTPTQTFDIVYGDGSEYVGIEVTDQLTMGTLQTTQTFATIFSFTDPSFDALPFGGIIGLGFQARSLNNIVTPLQNFYDNGQIDAEMFSLYLGGNNYAGGKLILGGVDPSRFTGNISYAPVYTGGSSENAPIYWVIETSTVYIGEDPAANVIASTSHTVIDSGSGYLYLPTDTFNNVLSLLSLDPFYGGYTCDYTKPNLNLQLNGFTLQLGPREYLQPYERYGKTICNHVFQILDILDSYGNYMYIFGTPLFQKYYTVFDMTQQQVGFALSFTPMAPTYPSTRSPTTTPTLLPSHSPTIASTHTPTGAPSFKPTVVPTIASTSRPTAEPSSKPTANPSATPSLKPTAEPSSKPTTRPTNEPSIKPTATPTTEPSFRPTIQPSWKPTTRPTTEPSAKPTAEPTFTSSAKPTSQPTYKPTAAPSFRPSALPSTEPSIRPTASPSTRKPSAEPSRKPSAEPTFKNAPTVQAGITITNDDDQSGYRGGDSSDGSADDQSSGTQPPGDALAAPATDDQSADSTSAAAADA